jgi:mannose-1-phosphate guanylyltransferase
MRANTSLEPRAMILAAGLGTRLRPLTDELPKPLVPVGDRSVVAHIAERLAAARIREAALNTHHLAEAFTPEILASLPLSLRIFHETAILGTAGGVANAAPALGEGEVIVWNGDILVDLDLGVLLGAHRRRGALATLVVSPRLIGDGTLGLGRRGEVVRLRGERFGEETSGGDFLGIYAMSPALRARLPAEGCLVGDVCLPALRAGEALGTFLVRGPWDDIGTVAAYLRANARWLERAGKSAYVGEGATVSEGVALSGCVVGKGARVTGEGEMSGVVIWPGAQAEAPLSDAVVTKRGTVLAMG